MIQLLECNHAFQTDKEDALQTPEHKVRLDEQRELFDLKLRTLLETSEGTKNICEETKHGEDTFALRLAKERNIGYLNIDMTPEQRIEAGIPENYTSFPEKERAPFYRLREEFFVGRITSACDPDSDALVVCGKDHVATVAQFLTDRGFPVEIHRLNQAEGFDPNWDSI